MERTIRNRLQDVIVRLTEGRLRRVVTKALAVAPRGLIPHGALLLSKLSGQLDVEWRTRDIHPWDRSLPADRRAALFLEQTLHDTDAVIVRLFRWLPEINAIDVRVLEPGERQRLLLAGTVLREEALGARALASPGMRLNVMGIRYRASNGHLEPLL